jgi:hypothetical protein
MEVVNATRDHTTRIIRVATTNQRAERLSQEHDWRNAMKKYIIILQTYFAVTFNDSGNFERRLWLAKKISKRDNNL